MREYESRQASEGELTEQDMPADLLAGVEANQSEDDRLAAVLGLHPQASLGHMAAEHSVPSCCVCYQSSRVVSMSVPPGHACLLYSPIFRV